MEQVLHQLLSENAGNPTNAASNIIPTDAANDIANSLVSMLNNNVDQNGEVGGPSTAGEVGERDAEMEDELAGELAEGDALSDYDLEVTKEGEAINEYLALLDSAGK